LQISVKSFTELGGRADLLHTFNLELCIWPDAFCDGSNKGTASNIVQISKKVLWRPWQLSDRRSGMKA
jgi:hypothetical protein